MKGHDMQPNKKFLAAAALTASLVAGGALGAMFGTPSLSLAQAESDQGVERAERPADGRRFGGPEAAERRAGEGEARLAEGDGEGRPRRGHPHRRLALEAAAETLGMTPEELRAELQAGKSVRAVAEERGVDVQSVIDAIVAAVTEHAQERATEFVNRERPARGEGRDGPRQAPPAQGTAA